MSSRRHLGFNRARRRAQASALLAVVLSNEVARAQAADTRDAELRASGAVSVELPRCAQLPYDDAELRRMLELELRQRGLDPQAPGTLPRRAARLESLGCDAANDELVLSLVDASGHVAVRDLALGEVPAGARPRLLALLIAESLQALPATGAEAARERAPGPSGRGAAERAATREATVGTPSARAELGVAVLARSTLDELQPFWGVELNLGLPAWHGLRWAIDAAWVTHTASTGLGKLRADWWTAAFGLDLLHDGAVTIAIGPRVDVGYVIATGDNVPDAHGTDQSAALLLLGARASVAASLGGAWRLTAALEARRPLRGLVLTADGEPSLTLDAWIAGLGLGIRGQL